MHRELLDDIEHEVIVSPLRRERDAHGQRDAVVVLRPPLGRVRLRRADEPGIVPERDGR